MISIQSKRLICKITEERISLLFFCCAIANSLRGIATVAFRKFSAAPDRFTIRRTERHAVEATPEGASSAKAEGFVRTWHCLSRHHALRPWKLPHLDRFMVADREAFC